MHLLRFSKRNSGCRSDSHTDYCLDVQGQGSAFLFLKPYYFSHQSHAETHLRLPLPCDILPHPPHCISRASSVAGVHAPPATWHFSTHPWLPSAFPQPSVTTAPDQSYAKGWNNEMNNDFQNNLQAFRTTKTNSLKRKPIFCCFLYWSTEVLS